MKKLTQTVLVLLLTSVFILVFIGCPDDMPELTDGNRAADLPQRDAKIYSKATVEDDFDDSSLVVILDNFKKEYVQDLTIITDSSRTIDKGSFRQIFEIKLPKESAGKEQVLKAIRTLEKIEGILYAGPNYYC